MKNKDESIRLFTAAIQIDNNYGAAYYNRGCVYCTLKKYDEAILDFDKVIEVDKTNIGAYYNRGIAFNSIHKYEDGKINITNELLNFVNSLL